MTRAEQVGSALARLEDRQKDVNVAAMAVAYRWSGRVEAGPTIEVLLAELIRAMSETVEVTR